MIRAFIVLSVACAVSCSPGAAGDPAAGAAVYSEKCATCHGDDGSGLDNGDPTTSGIDLGARLEEISDGQIARTIAEGAGEMAPVDLTKEESDDLIAFFRHEWAR
jgi:mono/diheme cytochrome c family protein